MDNDKQKELDEIISIFIRSGKQIRNSCGASASFEQYIQSLQKEKPTQKKEEEE
ncbi:MAG: hypothetical protein FWD76_01900 [Firmicutes bacterium]|nr:hypothetical protein [Bacillota bacterium]